MQYMYALYVSQTAILLSLSGKKLNYLKLPLTEVFHYPPQQAEHITDNLQSHELVIYNTMTRSVMQATTITLNGSNLQ